ncbi:MAG: hypothetical protein F4164_05665 [Gemmatimonadales bacterium]|nr:hypothetical protein [Gemmatimonadales bacterium]MYG48857.1 hypothetical protein [Gemmatimonadales bacterium]MYK03102.1 hypothetical protein [Candidatus Palauibacter ramosifaciens]
MTTSPLVAQEVEIGPVATMESSPLRPSSLGAQATWTLGGGVFRGAGTVWYVRHNDVWHEMTFMAGARIQSDSPFFAQCRPDTPAGMMTDHAPPGESMEMHMEDHWRNDPRLAFSVGADLDRTVFTFGYWTNELGEGGFNYFAISAALKL